MRDLTSEETTTDRPQGTITVVMGDVEGSTPNWDRNPDGMSAAMRLHEELLAELSLHHNGDRVREQGEGDNFVIVFARARDAVAFATEFQLALNATDWPDGVALRVRVGIHTGDAYQDPVNGYTGPVFNRCARLRDLGHGGQVLLSSAARDVASDALPVGAAFTDLGPVELRGLGRDEHVCQLIHPGLPNDFAPLRTAERLPNNLPIAPTPFLGRDQEASELADELTRSKVLTLTGAGGSGKTRLAMWLGEKHLAKFPDGVWWVDLGPVADTGRVALTILSAAGMTEEPGIEAIDLVRRQFKERRALLILDNCEHLIDGAAEVAADLVANCPQVVMLATSREPLGIAGEVTRRVMSMSAPAEGEETAESLSRHDATALFVERARAVGRFEPSDEDAVVIARICRRLDGIPLAIELAAARTKMLGVREIAEGLDDRFRLLTSRARTAAARQKTLAASMAWSYDLLQGDEQVLLNRIGVFAGWFDLAGTHAVAGHDDPYLDALDILESLVDKSLVQVQKDELGTRYRLLETVRAYALDRLADANEIEATQDAHLEHFTVTAERLGADIVTPEFKEAGRQMAARFDDIRQAIDWAEQSQQFDHLLRIAEATLEYCFSNLYLVEIANVLTKAFGAATLGPAYEARAVSLAAGPAAISGDIAMGVLLGERAVELGRDLDLPIVELRGRYAMIAVCLWSGHPGAYAEHVSAGIALAETFGHDPTAISLLDMAYDCLIHAKGVDAAREHKSRVRQMAEELGYERRLAVMRTTEAAWDVLAGRFEVSMARGEAILADAPPALQATIHSMVHSAVFAFVQLAEGKVEAARSSVLAGIEAASGRSVIRDVAQVHRAVVLLAIGDLAEVSPLLESMDEDFRGAPRGDAYMLWLSLLRVEEAVAKQNLEQASERMTAALVFADLEDIDLDGGVRLFYAMGRTALLSGDLDGALASAIRAVQDAAMGQFLYWLPRQLDLTAQVLVRLERAIEAARFLGAADRLHDELGSVRFPVDREPIATLVAKLTTVLGADDWETAHAEGASIPWSEFVETHAALT